MCHDRQALGVSVHLMRFIETFTHRNFVLVGLVSGNNEQD